LLEQARARCSPKSDYDLRRIEKLVAERLDMQRKVQPSEQERRDQIERAPAKRLVSWITEERDGVSNHVSEVQCAEPGSPDFGFCEARHPSFREMSVRYWKAQKGAFRYSFSTQGPFSCQDLGDHRRVRSWSRDQTNYELCELVEHQLRSLSVLLLRTPVKTTVHVFSYAYVERDKDFEQLLQARP
jgi:hypothetical protein